MIQRFCKRPTTEQILRLFSLAERHTLIRGNRAAQIFPADLTDLQCQVLGLLGVPEHACDWRFSSLLQVLDVAGATAVYNGVINPG